MAVSRLTLLIFPTRLLRAHSFFFNDRPTTEIYPLSLQDALPISPRLRPVRGRGVDLRLFRYLPASPRRSRSCGVAVFSLGRVAYEDGSHFGATQAQPSGALSTLAGGY